MAETDFRWVAGDTLEFLKDRKTAPIECIPTPIPSWNALCGEEGGHDGLAKTWTVVVGGMPGSRKSYLALNLAAHAIRQGKKVGAINFEMSFEGYATRFLSVLTGINKDDIGWGEDFSDIAWAKAVTEANRIFKDTGGALITNNATAFHLGHIHEAYQKFADVGVEMVVVDYVQLIRAGVEDLKERAGKIAEALRELSHQHRMVTVALSQINRAGMKREDSPPRMHDLYGGMYWEANANQVVMLDHTYQQREGDDTLTQIIVDKNRHGTPLVEIPVRWIGETMTVEEDTSAQHGLSAIVEPMPAGFFDDPSSQSDSNDVSPQPEWSDEGA
jgi:replicative DNA helicase